MKLRALFFGLAVAAVISLGSAHAAILVTTDSGNLGEFHATNLGVVAGTATVLFDVPNLTSQMNTVNGAFITPELIAVNGPVTLLVTPTGVESYSLALVPATYQKTIGAVPGSQAILNFNLTTGVTPAILPAFFNAGGLVTSLAANANPNFDFSNFAAGNGAINFTLTATSITGAVVPTFASFFATPGAVAVGNGSFSQQAVPEPASMALMGIGLTGWLAFRRFGRKLLKV